MKTILDKPQLWSFREAARALRLPEADGPKAIRTLVRAHNMTPKPMMNHMAKGLDRADMEVLAKALNRTIEWPGEIQG